MPASAEVEATGINGQTGHEPTIRIGFKGKLEKLSDKEKLKGAGKGQGRQYTVPLLNEHIRPYP